MRRVLLVLSCVLACAKEAPSTGPADAVTSTQPTPARAAEDREAQKAEAEAVADEAEDGPLVAPVEAAPTKHGEAAGIDAGGDLASLEAELDALEADLRAEGVRLRGYKRGDTSALRRRDDAGKGVTRPAPRCERRCELADAVCGLQARICTMAKAHASEPKYGAACRRAERDCERATVACDECEG